MLKICPKEKCCWLPSARCSRREEWLLNESLAPYCTASRRWEIGMWYGLMGLWDHAAMAWWPDSLCTCSRYGLLHLWDMLLWPDGPVLNLLWCVTLLWSIVILRFKIKWKFGGQIHKTWHIHTDGYFQTFFSFLLFSSKFQLPHLTHIHAELLYWFFNKTWEKPFWNFTKILWKWSQ